MTTGRFIVFEGLDGSGQSTQVALLADRLKKDGHKIHVTKEPTNNLIGGLIRGALTAEWKPSNRILQLLYAADRGHHVEREIVPALAKGYIVICDRYYYSSMAFGSINLEAKWIEQINAEFPAPDHAFYIEVEPQTAIKRIHANRFEIELFEKEKEKGPCGCNYGSRHCRDKVCAFLRKYNNLNSAPLCQCCCVGCQPRIRAEKLLQFPKHAAQAAGK
jgi:dTMP kinase